MRTALPQLLALLAWLVALAAPAQETKPPVTADRVRELAAAGKSLRGVALAGLDLAGLRCAGLDLTGTDWSKADLRGATFTGADFTAASLDEVVARGAAFYNCTLLDATMRRADLAGALLQGCELGGCDLTGSELNGMQLEGVSYSPSGGRYTDAVAAALEALVGGAEGAGVRITRPLAAGFCGDPFAFVYDAAAPSERSTRPFTQNPLRAAVAVAGLQVAALFDLPAVRAEAALREAVQAGKACLLPISLEGTELTGSDLREPFWAVAVGAGEAPGADRITLNIPPFGERQYTLRELASRWKGPCDTLEPVGVEPAQARYPLLILSKGPAARSARDMVNAALRSAVEIIGERRTYSTFYPGAGGLRRLADDLAAAAKSGDPQALPRLAPWATAPRKLLAGARLEAAEFLDRAAELLPETERPALVRAAGAFRTEAQLLAEKMPALEAGGGVSAEELRANAVEASRVLKEAADLETTAAGLLSGRQP